MKGDSSIAHNPGTSISMGTVGLSNGSGPTPAMLSRETRGSSKVDWWLIAVSAGRALSVTIVMTYAAALSVLQSEWGMSGAKAGTISSAYQIGYAVSLLGFSVLADRLGPKRLYLRSLFAGAFFSLAFAFFARGYLSALLLYTLVAISMGGTYTTGLMILADIYPAKRRGTATGFFIASTSLGYILSLTLSGFALSRGGYRLSFLLTCLGPAAGYLLSWVALAKVEERSSQRVKGQTFNKEVLSNKPARLLIWAYVFHCWELLGMTAWTPAFLAACLASEGARAAGYSAYVSATFHLAGLVASSSMGMLSDRLGRARVIIALSGVSSACSLVFGWTIGWPFLIVVGIGLIYSFSSLGDSPVLSAALTEEVAPSYLGAAFGLRSLLGFGAGALSPAVFGLVLDWTNNVRVTRTYYENWGLAFGMLAIGGLGAVWAASRLKGTSAGGDIQKGGRCS